MYEIIICDDGGAFASSLSSMLSRCFSERGMACHVTHYPDPRETLSALERGERCDLLFQDILFGEEKGIRFAKLLRQRGWDLDLVFVTGNERCAVAGYDVQALHYLIKPLKQDRLAEVPDRFPARRAPRLLSLTTPQGEMRLAASDALYFEVYDRVIRLFRRDGSCAYTAAIL